MRLSLEAARALPSGKSLADHVVSGLELRARGRFKVWAYRYRHSGKRRRYKLGLFPTLGLEAAREAAKLAAQRVAKGEDPAGERAAARQAPTMAQLAEEYLKAVGREVKAGTKKARTFEEYKRNINLHVLPQLGSAKVAEVTLAQINGLLDKVQKHGIVARNRVRVNLSAMFRLALHGDYGWRKGHNPMRDTQKITERKRRRKIESGEFVAVARELDRLQESWPRQVAVIRVSLFAGTRITELVTAKRSDRRGNRIVRHDHKTERTGDERVIFLPRQAVAVIDALSDDGSPYIFGRGLTKGAKHLTRYNVNDIWDKAREAAGCPTLQLRDMRRTFASVAGDVGIGLDPVGQLFGHKDPKTTRAYQWLYEDGAEENAQTTADAIARKMAPEPRHPEADVWSG